METDEITGTELAADPNTRQRLALTFTPTDIPPRIGEAFLLQFVSASVPAVTQERRPLHLGLGLDRQFSSRSTCYELRTVTDDAVGLISCEAADRTAAMYTNAGIPIGDPQTGLTVYSKIRFADRELQTAISQGMRTGTVPTSTADDTHPAPGAITVTWCTGPRQRHDDYYDIIPQLAAALDVVVTADLTTDRWLNGATTNQIEPVEPAFAGAYLNYARQLPTTLSTEAREQLERTTAPEAARCVRPESTGPSTLTNTTDTVERLAIASARLELSETVTPAHVETAGQLYANTVHEIDEKATT